MHRRSLTNDARMRWGAPRGMFRVVDDASPRQGVVEGVAVQLDVLIDEGEGPFQAHAVDVVKVVQCVATADAPDQPLAEFCNHHRRLRVHGPAR